MAVYSNTITTPDGITLHYQDEGKKSAPAIVLIMGLGAQMTIWPDELYQGLVSKGYRVIRFDNRDTGLSTQLDELGNPSLLKTWLSRRLPITHSVPYKLEDMAEDVMALIDSLALKKVHIVGASMGGMIGQILAAKYKKKVVSLTSIMSNVSSVTERKPNFKLLLQLAKRPKPSNREAAIRYHIKLNRLIGSPAYPSDERTLHEQATRSIDRAYNPAGFKRQLVAITASGDRRHMMKKIKAPTLVIHGNDDPVIPVSGGKETARAIKRSKLKVVDGMGHDFPPALMYKMTNWISKHVKKAEKRRKEKKRQKRGRTKEAQSKKLI